MTLTTRDLETLRIPVKPQMWAWWIGLLVGLLFDVLGVAGIGSKVWGLAAMGFGFGVPFTWYTVHVLRNIVGKKLEVVLDATHVWLPPIIRGAQQIPLASIEKITTSSVSSHGVVTEIMTIVYKEDGKTKKGGVTTSTIGKQGYAALTDALAMRNLPFE